MDAAGLQALYIDELRRSLVPPIHPMVNGRQTETLIRRAECEAAAACTAADAVTWVWSDLHLGHEHSRSAFGRPFRTAAEADRAMMEAWYDQVAEGETIICLGDVTVDGEALAHHQDWWRRAPGTKWLVLGNHDVDPVNRIRPFDIDRTAMTLYAAGDPPLLLTHVPLLQVPHGAVNIHGLLSPACTPGPATLQVTARRGQHPRTRARAGVADAEPARQRQRRAAEVSAGETERNPAAGPPAGGRTDRPGTQHPSAAERRRTRDAVSKQQSDRIGKDRPERVAALPAANRQGAGHRWRDAEGPRRGSGQV